jgi:hypothetical protein
MQRKVEIAMMTSTLDTVYCSIRAACLGKSLPPDIHIHTYKNSLPLRERTTQLTNIYTLLYAIQRETVMFLQIVVSYRTYRPIAEGCGFIRETIHSIRNNADLTVALDVSNSTYLLRRYH